jgi:hypothetical protein
MKAMQSTKIRELRPALVDAGVLTVDQQAKSLTRNFTLRG